MITHKTLLLSAVLNTLPPSAFILIDALPPGFFLAAFAGFCGGLAGVLADWLQDGHFPGRWRAAAHTLLGALMAAFVWPMMFGALAAIGFSLPADMPQPTLQLFGGFWVGVFGAALIQIARRRIVEDPANDPE